MSFYRWAMRNGAAILFIISLLIFVVSLGTGLANPTSFGIVSGDINSRPTQAWIFFLTLISALSSAALTFAAACVLHRIDLALRKRGSGE